MIRRFFQIWAVIFMSFVTLRYVSERMHYDLIADYWQEIYFVIIAVTTSWLFAVTRSLRPVVAIFAAVGFFIAAKMEDPSGASIVAVLNGVSDRVLAYTDG